MSEQSKVLLAVTDLQLHYGPAGYCLEIESLEVYPDELVVVFGGTGSGKSYLLETVTGLQPLKTDSVQLLGSSLQKMSPDQSAMFRLANIGMLFRKHNLVESLNVAENVSLAAELNGTSHAKAQIAAGASLQAVGCSKLAEGFPVDLTPLEEQSVALARAIMGQGKLIVADEPTGDLNSADTAKWMGLLLEQVSKGYGCLLVTNDGQLAKYADRLYRIVDEQLLEARPVSEVAETDLQETPKEDGTITEEEAAQVPVSDTDVSDAETRDVIAVAEER